MIVDQIEDVLFGGEDEHQVCTSRGIQSQRVLHSHVYVSYLNPTRVLCIHAYNLGRMSRVSRMTKFSRIAIRFVNDFILYAPVRVPRIDIDTTGFSTSNIYNLRVAVKDEPCLKLRAYLNAFIQNLNWIDASHPLQFHASSYILTFEHSLGQCLPLNQCLEF